MKMNIRVDNSDYITKKDDKCRWKYNIRQHSILKTLKISKLHIDRNSYKNVFYYSEYYSNQIKNDLFTRTNKFIVYYISAKWSKVLHHNLL